MRYSRAISQPSHFLVVHLASPWHSAAPARTPARATASPAKWTRVRRCRTSTEPRPDVLSQEAAAARCRRRRTPDPSPMTGVHASQTHSPPDPLPLNPKARLSTRACAAPNLPSLCRGRGGAADGVFDAGEGGGAVPRRQRGSGGASEAPAGPQQAHVRPLFGRPQGLGARPASAVPLPPTARCSVLRCSPPHGVLARSTDPPGALSTGGGGTSSPSPPAASLPKPPRRAAARRYRWIY